MQLPLDGGGAPVGSLAQIDHSIDAWSKNLADNPRDFLASTNLAALYQGRARLSYDLGDYERALSAARTAVDRAVARTGTCHRGRDPVFAA